MRANAIRFSAPLTPTMRRYLEIAPTSATKPKPRVKNPARVPLPPSRPLSVASSASSTTGVPVDPPRQIGKPARPAPTLHKARSMRQLPVLPSAEPRLNSKTVESPPKRSPAKPRIPTPGRAQQDALRQSSKSRPGLARDNHPLPRSFSTFTASLATQTKPAHHALSTSQTRAPVSPPKVRPTPYSRPGMPKSASTLSLPARRQPPAAIPPAEREDYRPLSTSTTSAYAESVAAAIERRAFAVVPTQPSIHDGKSSAGDTSVGSSTAQQHQSPVRSATEAAAQIASPNQPSSTRSESLATQRFQAESLESPRPPSPFLPGTGSSVKNRIAMFEQRSRDGTKSPSPTPTISRVVSQSKPRSSSPLSQITRSFASGAGSAIDVPRPDSPLVRVGDTHRPQDQSAAGDESTGDTTFKVGVRGVPAEDPAELVEVFSARASPEIAQGPLSGSTTIVEDCNGADIVDSAKEATPLTQSTGAELDTENEASRRVVGPVEVSQDATGPSAQSPPTLEENPIDRPPKEDTTPPTCSPSTHSAESQPSLIDPQLKGTTQTEPTVPVSKAPRAGLPDRRPAAPRPQLGRVDRKPFKPTSHTLPTAASLARIASNTSKAAKDDLGASTTRPPLPKPAARIPSTQSKPPVEVRKVSTKPFPQSVSSATLAPPEQKRPHLPSSASVRSFSASTVASNLRSAPAPSEAGSTFGARSEIGRTTKLSIPPAPRKIVAGTLPLVRKEKIKRKAPLPSFVPARGNRPLASSSKSTTAPEPATGLTAKVKSVVARVKPETIPLPASPAEKAILPQQIPLPHSPLTQDPSSGPSSQLQSLRSKPSVVLTPLRKALSGTPIKAKVSPALLAESSIQVGGVGTDQRAAGSPIDLWRRSIPPSPVQVWQEAAPASPLADRRGSVPPSPLAIQHPHVEQDRAKDEPPISKSSDGSPGPRSAGVTGLDTLASPGSPLRTSRTKSSSFPSPLAIHSATVHGPVSPTPAKVHQDASSSGEVHSLASSSGEVESLTESRPAPVYHEPEDLPSPFLRTTTEGIPQTKLRLSLESTPSRLRLPPTSPSPLAMATLARISAEQLVAISPTSSRSRHSLFRADLPLPADPDLPSSSTRRTKASATSTLPASDGTEELLSDDDDELLGVQFNHPSWRSAKLRPKVKNQLHVDQDLLEFSSSSRSDKSNARPTSRTENKAIALTPIHGQRTDVLYSPERSVDILSKIVDGSPVKPKTPGSNRKALWERDSNAPESDE